MADVQQKYRPIIGTAAKAAGVAGVPGAFFAPFDIAAASGIWTAMIVAIAHASKHKIDKAYAAKIVAAVGTGGAAYLGGSRLLGTLLHAIPVAGSLAAMGINGLLNFWFTYRVGKAVSELFDRPDFAARDAGAVALKVVRALAPLPSGAELADAFDLAIDTADVVDAIKEGS